MHFDPPPLKITKTVRFTFWSFRISYGFKEEKEAAVSLAWLREQPHVVAPIASASRVEHVADLLASATLQLTHDELEELSVVSEWTPTDI